MSPHTHTGWNATAVSPCISHAAERAVVCGGGGGGELYHSKTGSDLTRLMQPAARAAAPVWHPQIQNDFCWIY